MKKNWYKKGDALLREIEREAPLGDGRLRVWYMGQHGFVVGLDGLIIYIDVMLNDFLDERKRSLRQFPAPFAPDAVHKADYYLCTHNHSDHLNLETLVPFAKASPETRFVVPAPWRSLLVKAGIADSRVIGARENEGLSLGDVVLAPVAAIHTHYVQDEPERDETGACTCLGYVLKSKAQGGFSLYHSGDTWVTPGLVATLKALGPLDMAFLPINGTDWERTGPEDLIGNMSALDAAKLARAVPVDLVIPSHFDLFANNSENPALFADAMYRLSPEKRFHISALGEKFVFER
jgi:L-ascorbate metabolism protein UlaG (beta-lactamase superfamily)